MLITILFIILAVLAAMFFFGGIAGLERKLRQSTRSARVEKRAARLKD